MFSPGLEQVRHAISPGGRPSGRVTFPPDLPQGVVRRQKGETTREDETTQQWLKRCVADHFEGDVRNVAVEENLALLLVVRWEGRMLEYANLQAVWTDVTLEQFLSGESRATHRYLRLDYDLQAIGPLLKEPFPHVHVEPDGAPRFPVPASASDDVVGWFLDFVYRNFFHEAWVDWAEQSWTEWCSERSRENRWPRLVEAFQQGAVRLMAEDADLREDIAQLKLCLAEVRRRRPFFAVPANRSYWRLLSHDVTPEDRGAV